MKLAVDTLAPDGDAFSIALDQAEVLRFWGQQRADEVSRIVIVQANVLLRPHLGGVELVGSVRLQGQTVCGRCLAELPLDMRENVRVRFEPARPVPVELELTDAVFDVVEFDGETIDLAAWLAEQAALLLPQHPRCEDWRGRACQQTLGETAGTQAKIDPRWAGLQALLGRKDRL